MDVEPTNDTFFDPSRTSFPSNDSVEVPPPPTQDVLPKTTGVALSFIKPASTLTQATQSLGERPQPHARTDPVAQKIKTMSRAPNER